MRSRRLLAVLLLVGLPAVQGSLLRAEIVDRVVAMVDRDVITLSEAEQARELRMVRGAADASLAEVVERLIEARLIEREVGRYPAEPISDEDVARAEQSVHRQFPSEADFRMALEDQGIGEADLRQLLRRQLVISRYLDRRFRAMVYVSDEEIRDYYQKELLPLLSADHEKAPPMESVAPVIHQILEEREFNHRVDGWIEELKERANIRRYVW